MVTERALRVLLIDDDKDDFILTREMLREVTWQKFELDWRPNFNDGLDAVRGDCYDIALIDYDLGGRTGVDLIQTLTAQGCNIPLVLYTGRGNNSVDMEAMQAGATMYLTKNEANPLLLERIIRYAIERKQSEQVAARSQELYSSLFNNHHTPMLVIDADDGRIVDANPAAVKFYGWSRDQLLQMCISDINAAPPEQVREKMREAAASPFGCVFQFPHRLASGEIRSVEIHTGPVRLGNKQYLHSIIHDHTR